MRTILVTGCAGFIGRNLVKELLKDNENYVVGIDNLSTGKEENITDFMNKVRFSFSQIDIRDYEMLLNVFKLSEPGIVFHLAADPRLQYSNTEPLQTFNNNVNGTLNVLEACRLTKVKRLVFTSSSGVYGDVNVDTIPEYEERKPLSHYTTHKLIGEELCKLYYKLYGLEVIMLRLFNVFGEYQNPSGDYSALIPKTIRRCLDFENPIIYGDGFQTRDFIYVKDVVSAFIKAGETDNKDCFGEAFNIGTGVGTSVNNIVNEIMRLTGDVNFEIIYKAPLIESRYVKADVDKARKVLGWEVKVTLSEGLKNTINFFEE